MNVRSAERRHCRMNSAILYMRQLADCRIIDISHSGLGLEIDTSFHATAGSTVIIENQDLGFLEGIVRWTKDGRLGVQFRHNSNSIAQVTAYFRNFH